MTTTARWTKAFFTEAGHIAGIAPLHAAHTDRWNQLEDKINALAHWQVDALLTYCEAHATDNWQAACVITSMIPDDYYTPTATDLLEA